MTSTRWPPAPDSLKALIFDLDGTLVGTRAEYRYDLVGRVLSGLGSTAHRADIDRFWFEAGRDRLIADRFGVSPGTFWASYDLLDLVEYRAEHTAPYPDVGALQVLAEAGYRLGIVTGAPPHIAKMELQLLTGCTFASIVVIGEHDHLRAKPDPASLSMCLADLGVTPAEALYVGNSDEDIGLARIVGVPAIHIVRGEHEFGELEPDATITSLHELTELLGIQQP